MPRTSRLTRALASSNLRNRFSLLNREKKRGLKEDTFKFDPTMAKGDEEDEKLMISKREVRLQNRFPSTQDGDLKEAPKLMQKSHSENRLPTKSIDVGSIVIQSELDAKNSIYVSKREFNTKTDSRLTKADTDDFKEEEGSSKFSEETISNHAPVADSKKVGQDVQAAKAAIQAKLAAMKQRRLENGLGNFNKKAESANLEVLAEEQDTVHEEELVIKETKEVVKKAKNIKDNAAMICPSNRYINMDALPVDSNEEIDEEENDDDDYEKDAEKTMIDKNSAKGTMESVSYNDNSKRANHRLTMNEYRKTILKINEINLLDKMGFMTRPILPGKTLQLTIVRDKSGLVNKLFPKFHLYLSVK